MARQSSNSTTFDDLPDTAFAREAQLVPSPLPFSSATLWRKVRAKKFPAPIKLGERMTAWRVGDVRKWIAEQSAAAASASK